MTRAERRELKRAWDCAVGAVALALILLVLIQEARCGFCSF